MNVAPDLNNHLRSRDLFRSLIIKKNRSKVRDSHWIEDQSCGIGESKSLEKSKNRKKSDKIGKIRFHFLLDFLPKWQNAIKCQNGCTSGQGPASEYLFQTLITLEPEALHKKSDKIGKIGFDLNSDPTALVQTDNQCTMSFLLQRSGNRNSLVKKYQEDIC